MSLAKHFTIFKSSYQICDDFGEPYRFNSYDEAKAFIIDFLDADPQDYDIVPQF